MYRPGESMRLEDLKLKGFNPTTILDIVAHSGQFYGWAKNVWPEAFIWMIEANECHENTLKNIVSLNNDKYTIATVGDIKREVSFYKNKFTNNLEIYYQEQNIYLKDDKSLFKLSE